jgi:hypothetical protein
MEDNVVIPVEFTMEPGTDVYAELEYYREVMPWFKYLVDNSTSHSIKHHYEPDPHYTVITVNFKISPAKETYYNLKYR